MAFKRQERFYCVFWTIFRLFCKIKSFEFTKGQHFFFENNQQIFICSTKDKDRVIFLTFLEISLISDSIFE